MPSWVLVVLPSPGHPRDLGKRGLNSHIVQNVNRGPAIEDRSKVRSHLRGQARKGYKHALPRYRSTKHTIGRAKTMVAAPRGRFLSLFDGRPNDRGNSWRNGDKTVHGPLLSTPLQARANCARTRPRGHQRAQPLHGQFNGV